MTLHGRNQPPSAAALLEALAELGVVVTATTLTVSGGAAFAKGEIGYLHTDGTVRKAIDTSATTAEAVCICVAPAGVADLASGLFLCASGLVTGLSGGTAGALGYVGAVAGAIGVMPTTAGRFRKLIGRWITATVFLFEPNPYAQPDEVS